MHQLGVGWKGDGFFLHGRIDDDLGKVRRLRRAGARCDREALLDKSDETLPRFCGHRIKRLGALPVRE